MKQLDQLVEAELGGALMRKEELRSSAVDELQGEVQALREIATRYITTQTQLKDKWVKEIAGLENQIAAFFSFLEVRGLEAEFKEWQAGHEQAHRENQVGQMSQANLL